MPTVTVESLAVLQRIVARTGLPGVWVQLGENHHQFHAESERILNWWPSTGRVYFQGKNFDQLEFIFVQSITDDMPGTELTSFRNAA
jgi:hypothetical protein